MAPHLDLNVIVVGSTSSLRRKCDTSTIQWWTFGAPGGGDAGEDKDVRAARKGQTVERAA